MTKSSMVGDMWSGSVSRWRALFPAAPWLPAYRVQWLHGDIADGADTLIGGTVGAAEGALMGAMWW